jgi:hypothetical protein
MILSTMRRPYALIVAFLLVALFATLLAGTASAKDLVSIPMDKRVEVSPGVYAHLIQLTISDTTYGASFASDPSQVVFPVLVYQYENHGNISQGGHLKVRFTDDKGQSYTGDDAGMMDMIKPGSTSSTRLIEVNIPKDRKVTEITVILGFDEQTFPISDSNAVTPTATSAGPTAQGSASPKGNLCISMVLLPLVVVGVTWFGTRAIRK